MGRVDKARNENASRSHGGRTRRIHRTETLALSYDHRIIDGRDAVQFLVAIKDTREDLERPLMRI